MHISGHDGRDVEQLTEINPGQTFVWRKPSFGSVRYPHIFGSCPIGHPAGQH